mmetsp:Transcript_62953/g.198826  ORF Transcript_62953/g.198826 Transcript_62953/m.198826 type:complete len:283 (+) Transcript_62953:440-1288(+)
MHVVVEGMAAVSEVKAVELLLQPVVGLPQQVPTHPLQALIPTEHAVHIGAQAPELRLRCGSLLNEALLQGRGGSLELPKPGGSEAGTKTQVLQLLLGPPHRLLATAQSALGLLHARGDVAQLLGHLLQLPELMLLLLAEFRVLLPPLGISLGQGTANQRTSLSQGHLAHRNMGLVGVALLCSGPLLASGHPSLQDPYAFLHLDTHLLELALKVLLLRFQSLLQACSEHRDPLCKLANLLVGRRHQSRGAGRHTLRAKGHPGSAEVQHPSRLGYEALRQVQRV